MHVPKKMTQHSLSPPPQIREWEREHADQKRGSTLVGKRYAIHHQHHSHSHSHSHVHSHSQRRCSSCAGRSEDALTAEALEALQRAVDTVRQQQQQTLVEGGEPAPSSSRGTSLTQPQSPRSSRVSQWIMECPLSFEGEEEEEISL
mgnify:CR=1 FL=1